MKNRNGGVTAPKGFQAAAAAAGIKYRDRTDMAMIWSETECRAAGTFTTNLVKAAPVLWDQKIVRESGKARVVICNSGIANACTGKEGFEACRRIAVAVSEQLHIPEDQVLIASTGVIGMPLPVDRFVRGAGILAESLAGTEEAGTAAARAIMTTDTKKKEAAVSFELEGKTVTIGGMCKGSGMIHPNMCTMLSFLTTDAAISQEMLARALSEDIQDTYHMISVDGDTSTNDTVLLMANGLAGNPEIIGEGEGFEKFKEALHEVNRRLCRMIAGDGEGATALLEVRIKGAESHKQAAVLAKSVITSSLTKTAVAGHDANWGRILCAMGYAGVYFEPDRTDLFFESRAGRIAILENGRVTEYSEAEATRILSEDEITIEADLHMGEEEAVAWGCDLTYDYIRINADYRS